VPGRTAACNDIKRAGREWNMEKWIKQREIHKGKILVFKLGL